MIYVIQTLHYNIFMACLGLPQTHDDVLGLLQEQTLTNVHCTKRRFSVKGEGPPSLPHYGRLINGH